MSIHGYALDTAPSLKQVYIGPFWSATIKMPGGLLLLREQYSRCAVSSWGLSCFLTTGIYWMHLEFVAIKSKP